MGNHQVRRGSQPPSFRRRRCRRSTPVGPARNRSLRGVRCICTRLAALTTAARRTQLQRGWRRRHCWSVTGPAARRVGDRRAVASAETAVRCTGWLASFDLGDVLTGDAELLGELSLGEPALNAQVHRNKPRSAAVLMLPRRLSEGITGGSSPVAACGRRSRRKWPTGCLRSCSSQLGDHRDAGASRKTASCATSGTQANGRSPRSSSVPAVGVLPVEHEPGQRLLVPVVPAGPAEHRGLVPPRARRRARG